MALPTLTDNRDLRDLVVNRIRRDGPMTFAEYMDLVLYHPELGYYRASRDPIGPTADYVTSPELSRLFGFTLARHVAETWRAAGSPEDWIVVELGPGSGVLARDILDGLATDETFTGRVRYILVEQSPSQRERQKAVLHSHRAQVEWRSDVASLPPTIQGHLLSNEFFDALPVHRVITTNGRISEVYVGLAGDGSLCDVTGEPSSPRLQEYFDALGLLPAEGNLAEVSLNAVDLMSVLSGKLSRGMITTLDYGYEAADLYAEWRRQGTLLCIYQHSYTDQPYERIGRQDITAHVDLTSLARAARHEGLTSDATLTQAEFLTSLGLATWGGGDDKQLEETFARRRVVTALTDPAGLGRIRVLRAHRGLDTRPK